MSHFKEYQAEKYNRKVIENNDGFISYSKFDDGSLLVHSLFITKERRNEGKGKEFEKLVIEKETPSLILCEVDLESNHPELPLVQFINHGYRISKTYSDRIVLYKEIKNGKA